MTSREPCAGAKSTLRLAAGGRTLLAMLLVGVSMLARGAVLPEDRADALYHYYNGGGVKVDGPALLVRKDFADKVSVAARYYTDSISSASIDVVTTASPYKDKRTEKALGIDYLYQNSLMSLSFSSSEENDYLADTLNMNVSHEMFHGLTTVSLGYTQGDDTVSRVDTDFEDSIDRWQYRLGLSQIITKSLIMSIDYESISEEGFLNNPYRSARVLGATLPERYPRTRDSQAVAVRAVQGLATEQGKTLSSVRLDYRYFQDNWDIKAHTVELGYQKYLGSRWLGELRYRYYTQNKASFYSDNFSAEQTYMARDKELSTFKSHAIGFKASYRFLDQRHGVDKATLNAAYDFVRFNYDDFTDVRTGGLYSFDASVVQLFVSFWY